MHIVTHLNVTIPRPVKRSVQSHVGARSPRGDGGGA
jgi:hypothetical protein